MRRVARRTVVGGLAAGAALVLGCREAPAPLLPLLPLLGPTATPAPPARSRPDSIALGLAVEPTTLAAPPGGEGWGGVAYANRLVANLVMCQLVGLDARGQPIADLAEAVPTLESGGAALVGDGDQRQLRCTFRLRAGARWSDDQPLTARDVVFSWQLALNPLLAPTLSTAHRYERVEAADDATVVFTAFSERSARAAAAREPNQYGFLRGQRGPVLDPLYLFGLPGSWIYPEHVVGQLVDGQPAASPRAAALLTTSPYARAPVGGGPFALQSWQVGQSLTFAARPEYHRGRPRLRGVAVAIGPPERLSAALAAGDLDLLTAEALGATPSAPASLRPTGLASTAVEGIDLNLDHPALGDRAVREALLRALDRPALAGLAGLAPADGPPTAPALARYPHDPARAADLLGSAGWAADPAGPRQRAGRRLELRLLTTDDPARRRLAEAIRDALAPAGVALAVEAVQPSALLARLGRRDFDLALYAQADGLDRLAELADRYAGAAIPTALAPWRGENYPGLSSPALDKILADAAATLERDRRADLLRQAEEALLSELPRLPLAARARAAAASPDLAGLELAGPPITESWNAHQWGLVVH